MAIDKQGGQKWMTVPMPVELYQQVANQAAANDRSIAAEARTLLRAALEGGAK